MSNTEYQASVDYQKTHTVIKEIMDKNVQKLNNGKKTPRERKQSQIQDIQRR